jgi:enoyl-CoA hydratase/carnithine racemase
VVRPHRPPGQARFITVATIRGRARGIGNEFLVALDVRFASREKAIFGQPEVGIGIIPGCGGMQRLSRLTGRARALEIIASGEDYEADMAERYGWINRAVPDAELDAFVDRFAQRIAFFDAESLVAVKAILNDENPRLPARASGPRTRASASCLPAIPCSSVSSS